CLLERHDRQSLLCLEGGESGSEHHTWRYNRRLSGCTQRTYRHGQSSRTSCLHLNARTSSSLYPDFAESVPIYVFIRYGDARLNCCRPKKVSVFDLEIAKLRTECCKDLIGATRDGIVVQIALDCLDE